MPDLAFRLKPPRQTELVLQDDRVNTVPTLHAAETFDIVVASILQVVTPLAHEQALTPDTRSRGKLLSWKRSDGRSSAVLLHHFATFWLCELHYPFHDSVSLLLVGAKNVGSCYNHFICEHIGFKDIGHWERPQRVQTVRITSWPFTPGNCHWYFPRRFQASSSLLVQPWLLHAGTSCQRSCSPGLLLMLATSSAVKLVQSLCF
jgi:hypothetical protein